MSSTAPDPTTTMLIGESEFPSPQGVLRALREPFSASSAIQAFASLHILPNDELQLLLRPRRNLLRVRHDRARQSRPALARPPPPHRRHSLPPHLRAALSILH